VTWQSAYYFMLFSGMVMIMVRIRILWLVGWLVGGYSHVFTLLPVVILTLQHVVCCTNNNTEDREQPHQL